LVETQVDEKDLKVAEKRVSPMESVAVCMKVVWKESRLVFQMELWMVDH
jgi:hypothetical protein